jgi:lipoyl-dependent peroxiredoxin
MLPAQAWTHFEWSDGMRRRATAVWNGTGLEGKGRLDTTSGALKLQPYDTGARFQDESGTSATNPEELMAAAHAGCFAMALSFQLSGAGHPPEELSVEAVVTIEKDADGTGWTIQSSNLKLRGKVPGIDAAQFQELAEKAKAGCPVSRALSVDVGLEAGLA